MLPLAKPIFNARPVAVRHLRASAARIVPLQHRLAPGEDLQAWVVNLANPAQPAKVRLTTLDPSVFGAPARLDILQRVVVWQRSHLWQGTAQTRTRGEVRGGGRKPRPQKGSGKARQGSTRSPHWRGGGVPHGPIPGDRSIDLNKKVRLMGLRVALSIKYGQGDLVIVDNLDDVAPKTKPLQQALHRHALTNALIVVGSAAAPTIPPALELASRNLVAADVIPFTKLTVMHALKRHTLVLTVDAARALEKYLRPEPKTSGPVN